VSLTLEQAQRKLRNIDRGNRPPIWLYHLLLIVIDATTYIYASEIFPTHLRASGLSLSLAGLFLASLTYTQAATSALSSIGWRYYIVFTVLSGLMVVLLICFFSETKNIALEDIALLLGDPVASATPVSADNIEMNKKDPSVANHVEYVV
jgi:hypothetical protein